MGSLTLTGNLFISSKGDDDKKTSATLIAFLSISIVKKQNNPVLSSEMKGK